MGDWFSIDRCSHPRHPARDNGSSQGKRRGIGGRESWFMHGVQLPNYLVQILIAATALYEAVEPNAVWRQLFSAMRGEISGTNQTHEGTKLIQFILHTFRAHDEEVQRIHLPLCFTAFLELLKVSVHPWDFAIADIYVNV